MVNICVPEFTDSIKAIVRELRENRRSYFKIWLPKVAYNNSNTNIRNWKDIGELEKGVQIDGRIMCFEWNLEGPSIDRREDIYRYCVEHSLDGDCWVVLTEKEYPKRQMTFFLDCKDNADYPDEWIHLLCFRKAAELLSFCREIADAYATLSGNPGFKLVRDNFKHTRGAQVYLEQNTHYYWYLDTLHREHFEIFDQFGKKHLGVSDLCPLKLKEGTAEIKKKPIL